MAHLITELTRSVAGSADYPNGDIKDNPDGTLVNRMMLTDLLQTFQKLMIDAGITPNGLDDNTTNGYQYIQGIANMNTLFVEDAGDWVDAGTPVVTRIGSTITIGTVNFNRYKILGKTLIWQFSFEVTIVGTPTALLLDYPAFMASGDVDLRNPAHTQLGLLGGGLAYYAVNGGTGGAGTRQVGISLATGATITSTSIVGGITTELFDNS